MEDEEKPLRCVEEMYGRFSTYISSTHLRGFSSSSIPSPQPIVKLFFIAVLGSQYVPYLLTCVVSRIVNIAFRSVTLITVDVPTLIHHNHWKSIVCIRILGFTLVYFIGLSKKTMTWVYHYIILHFHCSQYPLDPFWLSIPLPPSLETTDLLLAP